MAIQPTTDLATTRDSLGHSWHFAWDELDVIPWTFFAGMTKAEVKALFAEVDRRGLRPAG